MDPEVELKDFSVDEGLTDEDFLAYHHQLAASFSQFRRRVLLAASVILCLVAWSLLAFTYPSIRQGPETPSVSRSPLEQIQPARLSTYARARRDVEARQAQRFCRTKACTDFAQVIKENLAPNFTEIDPCYDFSQYVCGGWEEKHDYTSAQPKVHSLLLLSQQNEAIGRAMIERGYADYQSFVGATSTANRENFEKLRTVYDACMDENALEEAGAGPVEQLLRDLPAIVHDQNTGHRDMTAALIYLAKLDVFPVIGFGTDRDAGNPEVVSISVGEPRFGLLSAKFHSKGSGSVADYVSTMSEMFKNVNGDGGRKQFAEVAPKVVGLESRIAAAREGKSTAKDPSHYYNPKPIAGVDNLLPDVSLSRLIQAFVPTGYAPRQVILQSPEFYTRLRFILDETPTEVLENLFKWQILDTWAKRLSKKLSDPIRSLKNQIQGRPDTYTVPRWRICMDEIHTYLPMLESSFWAQSQVSREDMEYANRLVDDVQEAYIRRFDTRYWMGQDARARAKQKVMNMKKHVGYSTVSPNVLNPVTVRQRHASLQVSRDGHFANILNLTRLREEALWSPLSTRVDMNEWNDAASGVDAYYHPVWNQLALPAGLMRRPLFDRELPDYISYGSFGMIAAHEMAHGFDDLGSLYNENGAWRDWWDDATRAAYDRLTECFVDQYSGYPVQFPGGLNVSVNGKLTLGENIADSAGVVAAYDAWAKRAGDRPNEVLPDLPADISAPERLFFVSFATTWCSKASDDARFATVLGDEHSPNRYRVIGSLANSRQFREAFNCPIKEPTCELL